MTEKRRRRGRFCNESNLERRRFLFKTPRNIADSPYFLSESPRSYPAWNLHVGFLMISLSDPRSLAANSANFSGDKGARCISHSEPFFLTSDASQGEDTSVSIWTMHFSAFCSSSSALINTERKYKHVTAKPKLKNFFMLPSTIPNS